MPQPLLLLACLLPAQGQPGAVPPSAPEALAWTRTIALPEVHGRIDQMAADLGALELFAACSSQGTIEVVDLGQGKWLRRSAELDAPQGVALLPGLGLVAVSVAGDASVHFLDSKSLAERKVVEVGDDPQRLLLDPGGTELWVAYDPGIAIIDLARLEVARRIELPGRAAGMAAAPSGDRIFVNLPGSAVVGLVERSSAKLALRFPLADSTGNHALALDEPGTTLFVAPRSPAQFLVLDARAGKVQARLECIGDVGDLVWDVQRKRAYALGGEGAIDVFAEGERGWERLARVGTALGARTGLWIAEHERLYVAVPGRSGEADEIRVLVPR